MFEIVGHFGLSFWHLAADVHLLRREAFETSDVHARRGRTLRGAVL